MNRSNEDLSFKDLRFNLIGISYYYDLVYEWHIITVGLK